MARIRARSVKRSELRTNQKRGRVSARAWVDPNTGLAVNQSCSACASTIGLKLVKDRLLCMGCRRALGLDPGRGTTTREVTAEDVRKVRELKAAGTPHPQIAEEVGRGVATVSNIFSGYYDFLVKEVDA